MIVRYKPRPDRSQFVPSIVFADLHRIALPLLTRPRLRAHEETWHPSHRRQGHRMLQIRIRLERESTANRRLQPYSGNGAALPWCCYCGRLLTHREDPQLPHRGTDATREHIVPRSTVPSHLRNPEDVLPDCCRDCNSKRGSLPLLRFLLRHRLMWRSRIPPVSVPAGSPHQFCNAASAGVRCNTPRMPGVRLNLKGTP